jgi:hypothetical protein
MGPNRLPVPMRLSAACLVIGLLECSAARGEDWTAGDPADEGFDLKPFTKLDLDWMNGGGAEEAPAQSAQPGQPAAMPATSPTTPQATPTQPAKTAAESGTTGQPPIASPAGPSPAAQEPVPVIPKAPEVKVPLLKALVDKKILTPEEAVRIEKEEPGLIGKPFFTAIDSMSFGGTSYVGYTYTHKQKGSDTGDFEARRNYITLVGNLTPWMLFRTTLDIAKDSTTGNYEARLKYGYLYVKEIVPYTGVEFGVVHRPWIDYDESLGWLYRSVTTTFLENPDGAGVVNSADLGVNVMPATKYFSSSFGLFNGEGYDHVDRLGGQFFSNSAEGRFTIHALGNGDKKMNVYRDRYLNLTFSTVNNFHLNAGAGSGVLGSSANKYGTLDRYVYHWHLVYNQPAFLIAAHYAINQDRFQKSYTDIFGRSHSNSQDSSGFSVNGEVRPLFIVPNVDPAWRDKIALFGRVDYWNTDGTPPPDDPTLLAYQQDRWLYVYGVAYRVNPFVRLIANGYTSTRQEGRSLNSAGTAVVREASKDYNAVMMTAEIIW